MLQTQRQTYECAACHARYRGQEGIKYREPIGEARIVWKKVQMGKRLILLPLNEAGEGRFPCPACGETVIA